MIQPQPHQSYASFACPSCNYAIPATIPAGMVFPCPMCQTPITAPQGSGPTADQAAEYQAWAMQHGNAAAAVADAAAPVADPRRANFSSTSQQVLVRTRDGYYLVVGAHVDASHAWCLRAQNATSGELVWETPRQFEFATCPGTQEMGCRDGIIYLAVNGSIWAIDASNGHIYWQGRYPGRVMSHESMRGGDEMALYVVGGVVVVHVEDGANNEGVVGLNGHDGGMLWQRYDEERVYVEPTVQGGLLIKYHNGCELLEPGTGAIIASLRDDDFGEAKAMGGFIMVAVDDYGDGEQEGVLLCDPANGKQLGFLAAPDIEVGTWAGEGACQLGHLIVATANASDGGRLYVIDPNNPPRGGLRKKAGCYQARQIPGQGQLTFSNLQACADAICIDVGDYEGDVNRLLVLDPSTLAIRHDSGALPHDMSDSHFESMGSYVAYVVASNPDQSSYELRLVSTSSGQPLWSRPVGHWSGHYFTSDGYLAVYHDTDIELFHPGNGQVVAGYPWPRQ